MQKATTNYKYVSASGVLAPKNSYCHSTSTSSLVELYSWTFSHDRPAKNLVGEELAGLKNLYPCLFKLICLSSVAIIIL